MYVIEILKKIYEFEEDVKEIECGEKYTIKITLTGTYTVVIDSDSGAEEDDDVVIADIQVFNINNENISNEFDIKRMLNDLDYNISYDYLSQDITVDVFIDDEFVDMYKK